MSTVKVLDLPYITDLQPNTANTVIVGVDIPSDTTGILTLTTLARRLYSNNNLYVGNGDIIFANAIGEFVGNSNTYLQVVLQNRTSNGSGDFVITADDGTDSTYYIDMGMNGSTYNDPEYSALKAHDGYLFVEGNGTPANLVLGATGSASRVNFIVGGTESGNIVGYFDNTGVHSGSINSLVSSNVATLRGEITANAASANSVINTRISANISTVNLFTQAAFNKANNALANTTGILDGNLTINGSAETKKLIVNNTNLPSNEGLIVATITANNIIGTPSNPGYTFYSAVDGGNRIAGEAYGADANGYVAFIGRRARGTAELPSSIQTGDIILRVGGNGYGTTQFSQFADARIEFTATQNHTNTAKGTRIEFWATANNTNSSSLIASFNGESAEFTGAVSPQKGFIYTPKVLNGAQTAVTISFADDSMVRFDVNNNMSITLSNYTAGKVVEVWMTNSAGQNRTITHGCLANNATVKSTTFTILSGSCAYLRYFSIGTTTDNTFVSIVA
jgi:hypothetical protein